MPPLRAFFRALPRNHDATARRSGRTTASAATSREQAMTMLQSITPREPSVPPFRSRPGGRFSSDSSPARAGGRGADGRRALAKPYAPGPGARHRGRPRSVLPVPDRPPHPRRVAGGAPARPPRLVDPPRRVAGKATGPHAEVAAQGPGVQRLRRPRLGPAGHAHLSIEPLPQDQRFSSPAWGQWPFNLYYQSFLLLQQWVQNATTGVRGVSPHAEQVVTFLGRQDPR